MRTCALAATLLLAAAAVAVTPQPAAAQGGAAQAGNSSVGFIPLPYGFELHGQQLQVLSGEVPTWVAGHVYRNGPAHWPTSNRPHWLEGLAFLQNYHFHNGSVTFDGQFIGSMIYNWSKPTGEEDTAQAVDNHLRAPSLPAFDARFEFSLNTLVTIQEIDGHLLTSTATTASNEFDRDTLANVAMPYIFPDDVPFLLAAEHHRRGPDGALYAVAYNELALPTMQSYTLLRTAANSTAREVFGHLPAKHGINYHHTFGVTKQYMVLADQPTRLPLIMTWNNFKMTPGVPVFWRVVSLATGEEVASFQSPGFFVFHQVNAYEAEDAQGNPTIVVDLIAFPDCSVIGEMYMDTMRSNYSIIMDYWREAQPMRYVLPMSNPGVEVLGTPHGRTAIEMPTMNPAVEGLFYQFWYAMGASPDAVMYNEVVKFDVVSGTSLAWSSEGCSPTEPLFIPHPEAKAEDDGLLVSVVLDTLNHNTFLLVLNAKDLSEVARVAAPQMLPTSGHGIYSPRDSSAAKADRMPAPSDYETTFVADH